MIAVGITTFILMEAVSWYSVLEISVIAVLIVYPMLWYLEKKDFYSAFFVEKSPGEAKMSLVLLFVMLGVMTTIGWGLFEQKYTVLCGLLMWGFGDAAAALIGIPFGKHKIAKKSLEGSAAMFLAAFVLCLIGMKTHSNYAIDKIWEMSFLSALISCLSELYTPSKYDTFTVPLTALLSLLLLERIL